MSEQPDHELENCMACDKPFKDGDEYFWDVSGAHIHAECLGPERESYVDADENPLAPSALIPLSSIWKYE